MVSFLQVSGSGLGGASAVDQCIGQPSSCWTEEARDVVVDGLKS